MEKLHWVDLGLWDSTLGLNFQQSDLFFNLRNWNSILLAAFIIKCFLRQKSQNLGDVRPNLLSEILLWRQLLQKSSDILKSHGLVPSKKIFIFCVISH